MQYVMAAQGDQLNKFTKEGISYFDRSSEFNDFKSLIERPAWDVLEWRQEAISTIYELTSGHPYYTKQICQEVYETAVRNRDIHIGQEEVDRAAHALVKQLDVNAFMHFWEDGTQGSEAERRIQSLKRAKTCLAVGRWIEKGRPNQFEGLALEGERLGLHQGELRQLCEDFVARDIFDERHGAWEPKVAILTRWLQKGNSASVIGDRLGEKLEAIAQEREEAARVGHQEIEELLEHWPRVYQGRRITQQTISDWLGQVQKDTERRLLFKLLQGIRFISQEEISSSLRDIWDKRLKSGFPVIPRQRVSDVRRDIIVSYVGGPGKSSTHLARLLCKEAKISVNCILEPQRIAERIKKHEEHYKVTINGVLVVDDLIASGNTMEEGLEAMTTELGPILKDRSGGLLVVALLATEEGQVRIDSQVRNAAETLGIDVSLYVYDLVTPDGFAFGVGASIWEDDNEQAAAKKLVISLGAKLSKRQPLGYKNQGLLVVFSDNCPNNSLPILHTSASDWNALFERQR